MMEIKTIRTFMFPYGQKNIEDCSKEELLKVVDYLFNELKNEKELHKTTLNLLGSMCSLE